ncbi:MAG: triose-phosphate isomerase, partial [Chlamydiota bacterium]
MKRKLILVGNWKMHKTRGETKAFVHELAHEVQSASCGVFIAPPFTALAAAASSAQGSQIVIGAQNMHDAEEGAFTGEISAKMLQEAGARFVILGHSERRTLFQESNAFINRKVKRALETHLQPILCIGETMEEREEGETEEVLKRQLEECLNGVPPEGIIIAYEPVWAIGTGKVATPESAQEVHLFCRGLLEKKFGKEIAEKLP